MTEPPQPAEPLEPFYTAAFKLVVDLAEASPQQMPRGRLANDDANTNLTVPRPQASCYPDVNELLGQGPMVLHICSLLLTVHGFEGVCLLQQQALASGTGSLNTNSSSSTAGSKHLGGVSGRGGSSVSSINLRPRESRLSFGSGQLPAGGATLQQQTEGLLLLQADAFAAPPAVGHWSCRNLQQQQPQQHNKLSCESTFASERPQGECLVAVLSQLFEQHWKQLRYASHMRSVFAAAAAESAA